MAALTLFLALLAGPAELRPGAWHAWLDSPGGELPFGLELEAGSQGWEAWIVNGDERIHVPDVRFERSGELVIEMPHFDARLIARTSEGGARMEGRWERKGEGDSWNRLGFTATLGAAPRFAPETMTWAESPPSLDGRWAIDFEQDDQPAVGVFETAEDGVATGTILTAAGDYRFLAGRYEGGRLRLSCFDGAHAFLFEAVARPGGTLAGDFWSRDIWHETWVARPDGAIEVPDGFGQTASAGVVPLGGFRFHDLKGRLRSLDDPEYFGIARIVQVFGSWCPNCHDASELMAELDECYRGRGLSIVGLAFEHAGDFKRDAEQVRRYAERNGIEYPLLLAGLSDKEAASAAFPVLDRVRAFPTTIFLRADGTVRAVHSGFTGPATGAAHEELRERFTALVEELLDT